MLMGILIFLPVITGLSFPNFTPIAIYFGTTSEEEQTLDALTETIPGIEVISYMNIHDLLTILAFQNNYGEVVLIGHGSSEGILHKGMIVTWEKIASEIEFIPTNKIFILACNGSESENYFRDKDVYSVPFKVDGPSLAYLYSIIITKGDDFLQNSALNKFYLRMTKIRNDLSQFAGLYILEPGLGLQEAILDGANLMMILFATIFTATALYVGSVQTPASWVTTFNIFITNNGLPKFIAWTRGLFDITIGITQGNLDLIFSGLVAVISYSSLMVGALIMVLFGNNIITQALALAALAVDIAFYATGANELLTAGKLLLLLAVGIHTFTKAINDLNDCDDIAYSSTNCAPSTDSIIGPSSGYVSTSYTYTFRATDWEGSTLLYDIYWGDGSSSTLSNVPSGIAKSLSHSWLSVASYTINFRAQDNTGAYSSWSTKTVSIINSGTGCVDKGTNVLLSDGFHERKAQSLNIGDEIAGYNVSSGEMVPVTITKIIISTVSSLLNINSDLLKVTVNYQPIYARNATYVGWVNDPQNLKIGDEIFNAFNNDWIKIENLEVLYGNFEVYDIGTDPLNTFIGNGILLDMPIKN